MLISTNGLSFDLNVNAIPVVQNQRAAINLSNAGGDAMATLNLSNIKQSDGTCSSVKKSKSADDFDNLPG